MNHSGCELIAAVRLFGGTRLAPAAPDQASPEPDRSMRGKDGSKLRLQLRQQVILRIPLSRRATRYALGWTIDVEALMKMARLLSGEEVAE